MGRVDRDVGESGKGWEEDRPYTSKGNRKSSKNRKEREDCSLCWK